MESLDNRENEILKLLCTDAVALENFLIESENPRFLFFLNGKNEYRLDIFKQGFTPKASQWQEHSNFWLPAIYLQKIAERLEKETNIDNSIRQKYLSYITKALCDIIEGYTKEKKYDFDVMQMIFQMIQIQDIASLEGEIFNFILTTLKSKNVPIVIHNITSILSKMLLQEINIDGIKQCIKLMIELLPNEYTSSNYTNSIIKEFLLSKEHITKFSDIWDDDFLLELANKLSQTLEEDKEISIQDEIEIKIKDDCSLQVKIPKTSIQFILPYVEFKDKEKDIIPIIEKGLQNYNDPDKKLLTKKILYWYTYVWADLTYISYPSLYEKPKGHTKYRQAIIICLLKEILLYRLSKKGLEEFLHVYRIITSQNKYFIFKRILLYCYGKEFEITRDILFDLIEQEKYLLFSLYFDAEMYNCLQDNVPKFTEEEKERIDQIINEGPYEERTWDQNKLDEDTLAKIKRYWQQERYAPLKEVEPFKQKYENLRKQTQMKEFFNFRDSGITELHFKTSLQDMEVLSLLKNDPDKYVRKMLEFDQTHPNRVNATMHEMPHPEGNADQLQYLANNYPQIITESIDKLSNLKPVYIRHILYGLRETNDRQSIKWEKVCSFVEQYVDKLVKDNQIHQDIDENTDDIIDVPKGHDIDAIIGAWVDIIREDKDLFNISEIQRLLLKYLRLLLDKYSFDYKGISYLQDGKEYPVDYLTLTINTVVGRVLEKLIRVILFENKQNISTLQGIYDEMLTKEVVEAHVFLGLYFIFFYQNIKEWTKNKINYILSLTNNKATQKYWEMFFEGFIKSNNQYIDYYEWLHDHYKKAIELYNGRGQERLIDILAQFFELGKDKLDSNSLISFCWKNKKFRLLAGCVREISLPLNESKIYENTSDEKEKIKEDKIVCKAQQLWNFLWEQINNNLGSLSESSTEQKELFMRMLELIPALPSLDRPTEGKIYQLLDCADNISWGMSNLLRNLIYLVEKNEYSEVEILSLARLYCKIIQKINYFTTPEQHHKIIKLIKKYLNDPEISEQFQLIKVIYETRKWNQYLDWF